MAEIRQLPIAHLVNSEPVRLHCGNLIEMLENASDSQKTAMTFLDRDFKETHKTYKELLLGASTVAHYLRNRGLKRSDKVLILLLTSDDFINAFFGTILAGGVPVAASPPMTFGDISKYLLNLNHIVENSEARFLITFSRIKKVIGNVLGSNNNLKELILSKDIVPERPLVPGFPSLDTEEPAFFQYTSGSTGLPKGAMLSHRALLSNVYGIAHGIQCGPNDVGVSWLPLFHDMGLIGGVLTALYTRAQLVSMLPESFVMDPGSWLRTITKFGGTIAVAPNFAYHLCANRISDEELSTFDLTKLKVAMNGAEPVDIHTLQLFEKRFAACGLRNNVAFPVYGMAENCLAATFPTLGQRFEVESMDRYRLEVHQEAVDTRPDDPFPFLAVSVGAPLAGQEVAILDSQGGGFTRERRVGEIVVRSPSLMSGYYHNEKESTQVIVDGWLHTGDLGFIHKGRLFITGRAKEMIIKRGRNYYPYDIERAASTVPGVRKGCLVAFSVPSVSHGTEDLVVVVETRETDEHQKRQMEQAITSEILSAVGIKPDRILLVPPRSIPKTSSGKLQRLLCRQRFIEGNLVKGMSDRWLSPFKTLVGSFLGRQRFRMRARTP
jgi:fatty-acyl-CoA synthase